MKSKSFNLPKISTEQALQNKTFDFSKYYTPTSENNVVLDEKQKSDERSSSESTSKTKSHISKRERSPNKKKKKFKNDSLNISKINVDGSSLPHSSESQNDTKVTSTPNVKGKTNLKENVKSIMKDLSVGATVSAPKNKPKKRNKSVSFVLDDTEEVAIKRSKSGSSTVDNKIPQSNKTKLNSLEHKITKKKSHNRKENKAGVNNFKVEIDVSNNNKTVSSNDVGTSGNVQSSEAMDIPVTEQENKTKLKNKKRKKAKPVANSASQEIENEEKIAEDEGKKIKKKKRRSKQAKDKTEEGEPATKSIKKEIKPDVIVQDLENLSIGDNAHTLTNLLDEMTVVDKKKKKNKHKSKKIKQHNATDIAPTDSNESNIGEEKEKVKWMKRKWNKDRKGLVNDNRHASSVVIENLPLKIMCNYKKLLTEHFTQFGMVKLVGIAEVYSIEHPEVFTTTISFDTEESANKALEEDNGLFEGSRIRVKRPLPPSQTTLFVKSYADLSEPALSSIYTSAGRIRNVRRLVKGKKSMCTAIIEFDGPEAVERAIKMAEDVKIGGKKIFAAKFELRNKNKKLKMDEKNKNDAGNDESSD